MFCFRNTSNLSGSLSKTTAEKIVQGRGWFPATIVMLPVLLTAIVETCRFAPKLFGPVADNHKGVRGFAYTPVKRPSPGSVYIVDGIGIYKGYII
jgi:hypothetical protein